MNRTPWQTCPLNDTGLVEKTVAVFSDIHTRFFAHDPAVNQNLPVVARSFRRDGDWRVFLLLTPWMLGRLLFPKQEPDLMLPEDWHAVERRDESRFTALGPSLRFQLHGESQTANIQFRPELGHFMIQPLAMAMNRFDSEEAAFTAWSSVVRKRDQMMKKKQKDCGWQRELSRRELFSGLFTHKDA